MCLKKYNDDGKSKLSEEINTLLLLLKNECNFYLFYTMQLTLYKPLWVTYVTIIFFYNFNFYDLVKKKIRHI